MRRLPKRKGVSLGTITMLIVTCLVVAGCGWLFPKFLGNADFRFDAKDLAVAFDRSYQDIVNAEIPAPSDNTPILPSTAPQPVITAPPTTLSFRLTASGNIEIDNGIQKAMTTDAGYQFADLFSLLRDDLGADLALCTLENTVIPTEKLTAINVPTDVLSSLQSVGFRAVCLGHSDALTGGISGLAATQESIHTAGMTPYGVYASQEQRDSLTIVDINGVSVALLSYQSDLSATSKRKTSNAEQAFAIAAPTLPTIAADIQTVKTNGAQVVIVSIAWGKKGASSPTQTQREMAQGIANAGADVIIGTSGGAVQTIEMLTATRSDGQKSQTLCAYSLGNLLTGDRDKRANISGLLLHANITYDTISRTTTFDQLSYTPTYVWRGKKTDRTVYAVLPSDQQPPAYITGDQLDIMGRSLVLIQELMKGTTIPQRERRNNFEVAPE